MTRRAEASHGSLSSAQETVQELGEVEPVGSPLRRRLLWALKLLVAASLLGVVVRRANLADVFAAMRSADPWLVLLALLANLLGSVIGVTRWRVLLHAQGVRVPLWEALQSYLSGIFFNNLLPSTIGGDALRAHDSWRWGARRSVALAVVAVDRMLGVLALLAFAATAMLLAPQLALRLPDLPLWLGSTAGVLLLVAVVSLLPISRRVQAGAAAGAGHPGSAILHKVHSLRTALHSFHDDRPALAKALALSFLLQLNVIVHYWLLARSLSLPVGFQPLFLIVPLSLVVMTLPVSVNGIGIRENVFAFFFSLYGIGASTSLAFAWISFGLVLFHGVLGGVIYALRRNPTALAEREAPTEVKTEKA